MLKRVEDSEFQLKGTPGEGLMGVGARVRKVGGLNFLTENMQKYGDIIPFRLGFRNYIQLNHPELIKHVLINHDKYSKGPTYRFYREILGDGLLTSFGKKWMQDRKIIQPIFDRKYIEGIYNKAVVEVIENVKQRWEGAVKEVKPINITREMSRLTMTIILKTMFSTRVDDEMIRKVDTAINTFLTYVGAPRMIFFINTFRFTRPVLYYQVRKQLKFMHEFIRGLVEERKKDPNPPEDMLNLLLKSKTDDGKDLSDIDIRDHTFSMIFAGYETTSVLLQWSWLLLDEHPEIVERLLEEFKKLEGSKSFHDIDELPLLDQFVKEVMRIYPPLWTTARMPIKDDVIGGFEVKAGTPILLPQYAMHRHPAYWKEPEKFRPEHFSPEEESARHPYCYFPFSLGPRKCAGWRFATMEAKMAIFNLLPLFDLKIVPGQSDKLRKIMSMRFEDDRMMTITKRN